VEAPAGKRQLRYRVSPADQGIDAINALSATIQSRMLEGFGLTADTTFVQRSTATT
jgi:ABC-type proline/glycine betaine transport system substrate-binding protein